MRLRSWERAEADILGAEKLSTVAAVMATLKVGELDMAGHTAVSTLVLDPVVSHDTAGLVSHTPAKHATLGVSHIHSLVIPASKENLIGMLAQVESR